MSDDVDNLTISQREALGQLQAITNGADIPSEIAILSSVNWNVQRAADIIFDVQSSASSKKVEKMQIDDSAQGPPPLPRTRSPIIRIGLNLVSLVTFPLSLSLNIISHLFHFIFRILRIPFPRFNITLNLSALTGRSSRQRAYLPDDPASVADRLVRELEDETGAMVVSRARASRREDGPGPSSAAVEQDVLFDTSKKLLPDFWLGSYESALDAAKRGAKVLCVILLSDEHEDVPEFRKSVLTNPELVRVLTENDFIVWLGDIRYSEGYQASMKLTATTYPFVAFISLQPRARTPSSSGPAQPSLAILSRYPGFTTADTLVTHITDTLLPRVTPFLSRIQTQNRAHELDRLLRQEQDRAFQAAELADNERIMRRRVEEAERVAQEEAARHAASEQRKQEQVRKRWRKWIQNHQEPEPEMGVRIGVRLPDGRRAIRRFSETDDVEALYTFVDGQLFPVDQQEGDDEKPQDYVPEWEFKLAVAFPRSEVPCVKGCKVGDIDALKGGANLVVEGFERGYESEGSEGNEA